MESFRITINNEVKKVERLLTPENLAMLDPQRTAKAVTLCGRIIDRGIEVIDAQINKYFDVANEIQSFKGTADYEGIYNGIWNTVNNDYIYPLEDQSSTYYMSVYLDYHLAGYRNADTQRAMDMLSQRSIPIEHKVDEYTLGSAWTLQWKDSAGNTSPVNIGPSITTSPKGQKLGSIFIPAQTSLIAELSFTSKVKPAFAFLQMVYPYDPTINANGQDVPLSIVAIDTLEVDKPITTRFALRIPDTYWQSGTNVLKLTFPNAYRESIPLHTAVQVFYRESDLQSAAPRETIQLLSNTSWKAFDTASGADVPLQVMEAPLFGIEKSTIDGMMDTQASPIWVQETPEAMFQNLVFETEFTLDTAYLEGSMSLVAPGISAVYLNGNLVEESLELITDTDPFMVYPNPVEIPAGMVVQGRNVIRIVVQNQTAFRGMLAEISITKAGKE